MGITVNRPVVDMGVLRGHSRTILRGTAAFLLASIVNTSSLFLISLAIARSLGSDGLGAYTVAITCIVVGTLIADMGIDSYIVRAFAPGITPPMMDFQTVFSAKLVLATAVAIAALAALSFGHWGSGSALAIASALVIPRAAAASLESYFKATQQRGVVLISTIVFALITSSVIVIGLDRGFDVTLTLATLLVCESLKASTLLLVFSRTTMASRLFIASAFTGIRRLLPATVPFALIGIISYVTSRADVLLLAGFKGPHEAGVYSAADRFMMTGNLIAFALYGSSLPVFASIADPTQRKLVIRRSLRVGASASFIAGSCLFLSAPFLIQVTFRFQESISLLQILAISFPGIIMNTLIGTALFALHEERRLVLILGSLCAVNLASNLLFIPRFGATASATISVLTEYAFTISYAILYVRRTALS